MRVDLLFYCEEERVHARCIQPNLRAKNGDLRLPYKYCSVLCSHSEALVIDPEQLRWLEVS